MKNRIGNFLLVLFIVMNLVACKGTDNSGENNLKCTFSIECGTVLDNVDKLSTEIAEVIPEDGVIVKEKEIVFSEGESVYDVLTRVCRDEKILMESSFTPGTGSAYIEGIANLYEFDCGKESGWMYSVNGEFPNVSCSDKKIKHGDVIRWQYTCNLGKDIKSELSGDN